MDEPPAPPSPDHEDDGPWLTTPDVLPDDPIAAAFERLEAREAARALSMPATPWSALVRACLLVGLAALACAIPGPETALVFLATTAVVGMHAQRGHAWGAMGLVGAVGVLGTLILVACLPALDRLEERGRRVRCASHLRQLGAALVLYRDQDGHAAWYPTRSGAEFLVALHVSGVLGPDVDVLCCPSTRDKARPTLLRYGAVPPNAVSYAGRRNVIQTRYPGLFLRSAPATVLASDDDEGAGKYFNHGDALHVLYLDGHVELIPTKDDRVAGGLGRSRLLDPLAN